MALFDFLKKKDAAIEIPAGPYSEPSTNLIYNLLFCDNVALYKANTPSQKAYPFNVLFNENSTVEDLQKIVDDHRADPRVRILAYNLQVAKGHTPAQKELLAVIVEIGFNAGPDVLASFNNGTARYINQTGKILIWETADATSAELTKNLFEHSGRIVQQIGPWDQPRRPHPATGMARITFLVSDGLYFGEAPLDALFNDALAGPALGAAAQLMKYLIGKSMEAEEKKA